MELSPDQRRFLGELSAYYIQTRYPEEINNLDSATTPDIAAHTLRKSEETVQWLLSMLE